MKLYNIQLYGKPIRSLLTARRILTTYPHKSLQAWMQTGKVGEWHGVLTDTYRSGELTVKRIQ